MAPRDVPDSSNIIYGKRLHKTPRAPDEVVSFAQHARSTTPQSEGLAPASLNSVGQTIQTMPPPAPLPHATVMDPNFALWTVDEGQENSLYGFDAPSHTGSTSAPPQTSPPRPVIVDEGQEASFPWFNFLSHTDSMLAPPQTSPPRPAVVDEDQENSLIGFDFSSHSPPMPPLGSPTASQEEHFQAPVEMSARQCNTANEEGKIVIWRSCRSAWLTDTHSLSHR